MRTTTGSLAIPILLISACGDPASTTVDAAQVRAMVQEQKQQRILQDLTSKYETALRKIAAGDDEIEGGVALLEQVSLVDREFLDVQAKLTEARKQLAAVRLPKILTSAKQAVASGKCGELRSAKTSLERASRMHLDSFTPVYQLLEQTGKGLLGCFEGDGPLKMALGIVDQNPLQLVVSIHNESPVPRHSNPGYFTLVTKSGQSLPYSTRTYRSDNAFRAVELQSGTVNMGAVTFDTGDAPKTLIYQEPAGARIERTFP